MRVRGILDPYVSRGAHKLKKALEAFAIDVRGETCIDVGASTGGFTDVLLRAGASMSMQWTWATTCSTTACAQMRA